MLGVARHLADKAGDDSASMAFLEADAQTHAFEASNFDVVFSRFGVMFLRTLWRPLPIFVTP